MLALPRTFVPLTTPSGISNVNAPCSTLNNSTGISIDEKTPICWCESNFRFTLEKDDSSNIEALSIEIFQYKNPSLLFRIECQNISLDKISELFPLDPLVKFHEEDSVPIHSVKLLFEKFSHLGLTPQIYDHNAQPIHYDLFLSQYNEIMSRPYRWEGMYAFNIGNRESPYINEKNFTPDLFEKENVTILVSTSLSSLNSRERLDTVVQLLSAMEKLNPHSITHSNTLKREIQERIVDCRFTQRDNEGGILRFRINLYLDPRTEQLFIVYDPWICSTSHKYPLDGSIYMDELLKTIVTESAPSTGKELYLEILDRVASSNESVSRTYHDELRRIEEGLVSEDSHPSPHTHMNAINALTYLLSRTEIVAKELSNCHKDDENPCAKIKKLISRFQQAQEIVRTILSSHQTKIDLADVIATRRETSERHNSDDIIRGGTVGILGGTFSLIAWEMSHQLLLAGSLAALSSMVIVGYSAKIYYRNRRLGFSLLESLKKIF